jgi:hypothetical protein
MPWEQLSKQNLVQEHKKLIQAIYDYDYFTKTFERALDSFILETNDPKSIQAFWHHLWYMLPDNPSIRRKPFYRICDFAEGAYLNEID